MQSASQSTGALPLHLTLFYLVSVLWEFSHWKILFLIELFIYSYISLYYAALYDLDFGYSLSY